MWPELLPNASQFSCAFCSNQYQFGQNACEIWMENPQRNRLQWCSLPSATCAWTGVLTVDGLNLTRKPSMSQAHSGSATPPTQTLGVLPQPWLIRPAILLGPNPNPWLSFQASVLMGLSPMPSRLGMLEAHSRSPPAIKEEILPFGAAQSPQIGRNPHASLRPPPIFCDPHWP